MQKEDRLYEACLIIYFLLLPLNNITLGSFGSGYKYLSLFVGAIFLLRFFLYGKIVLTTPIYMWGIYLIICFVSIIWSQNFGRSINSFIGLAEIYVITVLIQNNSFSLTLKDKLFKAIIFSGVIYLLILFFFSRTQIYTSREIISFGEFGGMDPNEWCCYMIAPVVLALSFFFKKEVNIVVKILIVIFEGLVLYGCVLSGSRGGLLSILVSITLSLLYFLRNNLKRICVILLGVVLLIGVFVIYVLPRLPDVLLERFKLENILSNGGSGRSDIWKESILYLLENPFRLFFGCGVYGAQKIPNTTHNQCLQVLIDNGLIGGVVYIAFLISIFNTAKNKDKVILICFLGIQCSLLFLSSYAWLKAVWMIYLLVLLDFKKESQIICSKENNCYYFSTQTRSSRKLKYE